MYTSVHATLRESDVIVWSSIRILSLYRLISAYIKLLSFEVDFLKIFADNRFIGGYHWIRCDFIHKSWYVSCLRNPQGKVLKKYRKISLRIATKNRELLERKVLNINIFLSYLNGKSRALAPIQNGRFWPLYKWDVIF